MELSIYFPPLDRLEMRLVEVKKAIFSSYKALRTHILPLDQPKMRFG